MIRKLLLFFIGTQLVFAQNPSQHNRTVDSVNTYFGTTYKDPFRWLEDLKAPSTEKWFMDQAERTNIVMRTIPGRDHLIEEWTELEQIQTAKFNSISFAKGRYFYHKRDTGDRVAKLYYRNGLNGDEVLLFDPSTFIEGKTLAIVTSIPSPDGKNIGISYTENGAETATIRIIDVDSKKVAPEIIYPSWDGVYSWTSDSKSFTYSWLQTDDNTSMDFTKDVKTKFHTVGTDVKDDIDYFSNKRYRN